MGNKQDRDVKKKKKKKKTISHHMCQLAISRKTRRGKLTANPESCVGN